MIGINKINNLENSGNLVTPVNDHGAIVMTDKDPITKGIENRRETDKETTTKETGNHLATGKGRGLSMPQIVTTHIEIGVMNAIREINRGTMR